jgi:succinoglycan biosynthesis protein ExoA
MTGAHPNSEVLVVVPCLNEEAHLPGLLSFLSAEAPGATIMVVDGGSRDNSAAIVMEAAARCPSIHLLHNPKRIQSSAVNMAARIAGKNIRWLIRVDAHCTYPMGYISGLLSAADRTGAESVVVPMVTRGVACFQTAVAAAQNSRLGTGGAAHRSIGRGGFVDHGHHALFELAAYRRVGGYDEALSHNEDAELDLRLTANGARILLEPSLAIIYHPRSDVRSLFRQYLSYGRGRAQTVQKHSSRLKLRQMLPLLTLPSLLLALAGPVQPMLAAPAVIWSGTCLIYGLVLAARAKDLCVAAAGVAAMTMHLAWAIGFYQQSYRSKRTTRRI